MLTQWSKLKLSLFGWVKGRDGLSLTERTLKQAARYRDLKTLRYLKSKNVPETIRGKWHILTYTDLRGARHMMSMGYGHSLSKKEKQNIILDHIKSDRMAFVDPKNIQFCREMGVSMGLKDKNGNNILLSGQTSESIQSWAEHAHMVQVADEFVAAAARNDVDMMKILNRSRPINLETRVNGKTAAFAAVAQGNELAALWLLRHHAKMDTKDAQQHSALETEKGKTLGPKLLTAAVRSNLTEAAQALINSGVSAKDPNLMSLAAENGNQLLLDFLHQKGSSPLEAQSDYKRRLDNLTRHESYDEKEADRIRNTLALLHKYTDRQA